MNKLRKQEFIAHRISWKWFENKYHKHHSIIDAMDSKEAFMMLVQLEILKELQHLNDK